jgi:hypothetical protein
MQNDEEVQLLKLLKDSMLPGQEGIKVRAFLAFNRENALASRENLDTLCAKETIMIKDDTIYPVETL